MLRIWRLGVSAGALVLLAGCQSFIGAFSVDDDLAAARNAAPPAGAFNAALQQEYIAISQIELDEYDFEHADTFALKAIAAANGDDVPPEDPSDWALTRDMAGQFYAARGQLLLALDNDGRTAAPRDAAQAQAMFDCWIQEQEIANEGHQPGDIAACREAFEVALARVQEAIAEPEPEPVAEIPPPAPEPPARLHGRSTPPCSRSTSRSLGSSSTSTILNMPIPSHSKPLPPRMVKTCSLKIPATGLYPGNWQDSSTPRAANSSWPWTTTAVPRRRAMRPRLRPCSTAGYRSKS